MGKLREAVRDGNLEQVKKRVAAGDDVNEQVLGNTPLTTAILRHQNDIVLFLLQLNQCDVERGCGRTPLMWACVLDNVTAAEALLRRGASVHAKHSDNGNTALHYAAENGSVPLTRLLLQWGATLVTNKRGETAIDYARENKHIQIVNLLINHKPHTPITNDMQTDTPTDTVTDTPTDTPSQLQQTVNQQREEIVVLQHQVTDNTQLISQLQDAHTDQLHINKQLFHANTQLQTELQQAGEQIKQQKQELQKVGGKIKQIHNSYKEELQKADMKIQQLEMSHADAQQKTQVRIAELEAALSTGRNPMVMEKYHLEPYTGQTDLSDSHLSRIADETAHDFKRLGLILGVKLPEVERMDRNHRDCWMACLNVLVNWRNSMDGSVEEKRQCLRHALTTVGKGGIVNLV